MKKIPLISAVLLLAATSAFAAKTTMICPFTDKFKIDAIVTGAQIINTPFTTGNLAYHQEGDKEFSLSCGSNVNLGAGDLFIDVGYSQVNKCTLTIHDGPMVMNPVVSYVNCIGGVSYAGIGHVDGKYEYTLKFN